MERNMYLVFAIEKEREVILGVFSSARRAQDTIKKLSKKKQYFIYKLPINSKIAKGTRKLENQLSKYLYQDLGTFKSEFIEVDDNDQIIKGYCQFDCVKLLSANFVRKGRFFGTFPMGFFLQWISIFTQTKARSV